MKNVLGLLRRVKSGAADDDTYGDTDGAGGGESLLFSTAFVELGAEGKEMVPWDARAVEVGARRLAPAAGAGRLHALWSSDRFMSRLSAEALRRLESFMEFASVPADRDLIRQDEHGDFMLVLLAGTVSVERQQPWGERLRLAETRPGDILGEMSLLDGGVRFSDCVTLGECEVAVLGAEGLDRMLVEEPALAASLIGLLARKLSLRLRALGARLTDNRDT